MLYLKLKFSNFICVLCEGDTVNFKEYMYFFRYEWFKKVIKEVLKYFKIDFRFSSISNLINGLKEGEVIRCYKSL